MFKHSTALIASFALTATSFVALAAAPPKAGTSCKSLGATQIYQNKKFTCIKSAKKLVWDRGTSIIKPAPSSSPNPTISPTPSPSPTIKTIAERWSEIDKSALNIFNEWASKEIATENKLKVDWRTGDSVDPAAVAEIKRRHDLAVRFWAPYSNVTKDYKVLIANHNEARWICNIKLDWLKGYQSMDECITVESNGIPDIPTAGQGQLGNHTLDMYEVKNLAELGTRFFVGRVEHEFTHNIFYEQSERYQDFMPCWQIEGGAEYFGILIANRLNASDFIQARNFAIDVSWMNLGVEKWKIDDWVSFLNKTDRTDILNRQGDPCGPVRPEIYHQVILANEYLVSKLGIPGYLELIKMASRSSWADAINKTFGIDKQTFYKEIAAYMMEQYKLVINNFWSYKELFNVPAGR